MKTNTDQAGGALKEYQLELLKQIELVRDGKLPAVVLWREMCSDLNAISSQIATLKAKAERVEALEGALEEAALAFEGFAVESECQLTKQFSRGHAKRARTALLSTQPAPKGGPQ